MNGRRRWYKKKRRKKRRKKCPPRSQLGREKRSHEKAAFLALAFLCWCVEQHTGRPVGAYIASRSEDLGKGTDAGLVYLGDGWRKLVRQRVIFVDVTTADRQTVRDKIERSIRKAKEGGRYVDIVSLLQNGPVLDVEIAGGFEDAYRRLRSTQAITLSPREIFPGEDEGAAKKRAKLTEALLELGGAIISRLGHRPDWQELFRVGDRWVWNLPIPDGED